MTNDGLYDEPGDTPPAGGFPEERRASLRRTDDRIAHDMESWVATLFVHRGKLVALASLVTFLFTSLGFRILGPSQEIKALDQKFTAKDSVMSVRVTRLEDGQYALKAQVDSARAEIRFVAFLQCTQLRHSDPMLAIDGCPRKP